MGIAVIAVVLAAPLRNFHPLHEGRNFYQLSAAELTRRWHEQSDTALPVVGGDDGLAFAMAFYSPDHPVYEESLVFTNTERLPRRAIVNRGWATLCFGGDVDCIDGMEKIAARASRFVRSEFVVQSTLLGRRGATQRFSAVIVPPFTEGTITSPPDGGVTEDFSAIRRTRPKPE